MHMQPLGPLLEALVRVSLLALANVVGSPWRLRHWMRGDERPPSRHYYKSRKRDENTPKAKQQLHPLLMCAAVRLKL